MVKLLPEQQFIADNGTDVRISHTIVANDYVEITGYSLQNELINMSAVHITSGSIGGVDVETLKATMKIYKHV